MAVRISSEVVGAILRETASAPDREVCGLLLGGKAGIAHHLSCRNVADDVRRAFEIDPVQLISAFKSARLGGPGIVGCYHSHPIGRAEPSARDAKAAIADEAFWLIAAGDDVQLWRAVQGGQRHGRFDPVAFELVPDLHQQLASAKAMS